MSFTRSLLINGSNYDSSRNLFVYKFPTSQNFDGYGVAFSSMSMYNSFFNVKAAWGNNVLSLAFPAYWTKNPLTGATLGSPVNSWTFTITLADGYYGMEDLNAAIQQVMVQYSLYVTGSDTQGHYFFTLIENEVQYGCQLNFFVVQQSSPSSWTVPSGAGWAFFTNGTTPSAPTVTFASQAFGDLIGYTAGSYGGQTADTSLLSTQTPEINPTASIILTCNLISDTLFIPNNQFFQFPITAAFGSIQQAVATTPAFMKVARNEYTEVEIGLLDQNLNSLSVYDTECSIMLLLQPPAPKPK